MSTQKVANNPLGSYPVLVDRTSDNSTMQVVRLDVGVGSAESRVTSDVFNPILTKAIVAHSVTLAISQTGATVWTPASGKKFVMTGYSLSSTADGVVQFFDSTNDSTHLMGYWSMAGAGWGVESDKFYKSQAVNNVLKYTTDGTATGVLIVYGYEE